MRSPLSGRLRDRRVDLVVLGGAVLAVTCVYVAVVLGGGLLIGHTDSPHVGLSILATAIVALGLEPLRAWLETAVRARLSGGRATPYDALSRFSESLADDVEPGQQAELPLRMARLLAEATGARWAQVWLVVDERPQLAAAWPQGSAPEQREREDDPGLRAHDVTLDGELLGVLRLQEHRDQPLSPVEERLFAGLAAQAGLVFHGARLRAELVRRADDLARLAADLQASRRRVVDTHDSERRRLERDIHDGAQQHLVALVVNLRLAHTLTSRSPDRARAVLAEQVAAVDDAITSLVDLSRGIYPTALTEDGVAAAVREVVASSTIPVTVLDTGIGRQAPDLETALYFCCVEAVQNAVKHAAADRIEVRLAVVGDRLELRVRDDGLGFDVPAVVAAGGLGNLRDRVDSVGGELEVRTNESGGTDVVVSVGQVV
jgi:signal transduction histidine kinase